MTEPKLAMWFMLLTCVTGCGDMDPSGASQPDVLSPDAATTTDVDTESCGACVDAPVSACTDNQTLTSYASAGTCNHNGECTYAVETGKLIIPETIIHERDCSRDGTVGILPDGKSKDLSNVVDSTPPAIAIYPDALLSVNRWWSPSCYCYFPVLYGRTVGV